MGRKRRRGGTDRRSPRRPGRRAPPTAAAPRGRRDRVLAAATLGVLLLLALVGDDRHVGLVADGRQMIRTAVAIAETGEIGQARGRDFSLPREAGDAVSRFGMATSLLQVPAALVAPRVEARRGPGASQTLFLVVPWLAIGLAGFAAGALARRLGAGDGRTVAAVLLATLASPLGSYAAMEFSEPVQAAALALGLLAALAAAEAPRARPGLELAAGFAAGFAVLAKSSLVVVAPALLLPLVERGDRARTRRALLRAVAGAAGPLALWLAFELVRFGRPFGGYPDDRFTHPWLDGLWRLLLGPNRGLLLFWPALLLFLLAGGRFLRERFGSPAGRAWLAAAWVTAAQLAIAAGYWGWHGMEGWGPRLVLAGIPLLAPFAATARLPVPRLVLPAVVGVCLLANLPPLLQHPTPVATYVMNCAWPEIPGREVARFPFYARSESATGSPTVVPFEVLEREPAANPWRVFLWFRRVSAAPDGELAARLAEPPWSGARPGIRPERVWPEEIARQVAPPPRWGFLGRSLARTGGPYATVYLDALLDQVIRAAQLGRVDAALRLSARRVRLGPTGEADAWRLESLRLAGRREAAAAYLGSLPLERRSEPMINLVLALFDRETGQTERARALLESVADSFPGTPVEAARRAPVARWPASLSELIRAERRDATVAAGSDGD